MDWNRYKDIVIQADKNVQAVVSNGRIDTSTVHFTNTRHVLERQSRLMNLFLRIGGAGKRILAVYLVDKGHRDGMELHWITEHAVVIVTNALKSDGLDICTFIPARVGQLTRYPRGGSSDWSVCERMFPDEEWHVPQDLIAKAKRNEELGMQYTESSRMTLNNYMEKMKMKTDSATIDEVYREIKSNFGDYIGIRMDKSQGCIRCFLRDGDDKEELYSIGDFLDAAHPDEVGYKVYGSGMRVFPLGCSFNEDSSEQDDTIYIPDDYDRLCDMIPSIYQKVFGVDYDENTENMAKQITQQLGPVEVRVILTDYDARMEDDGSYPERDATDEREADQILDPSMVDEFLFEILDDLYAGKTVSRKELSDDLYDRLDKLLNEKAKEWCQDDVISAREFYDRHWY